MMISLTARLTGVALNPDGNGEGWVLTLLLPPDGDALDVPVTAAEAVRMGAHIGQDVAVGIWAQYEAGTIQEREEL